MIIDVNNSSVVFGVKRFTTIETITLLKGKKRNTVLDYETLATDRLRNKSWEALDKA